MKKTQKKATAAGIRRVTANLDQLASLFQYNHASLGVNPRVAMDLAYRWDAMSDFLAKKAAEAEAEEAKAEEAEEAKAEEEPKKEASKAKKANFPAGSIGAEVGGPLRQDADESYLRGHFTQEIFSALTDKQVSGELAAAAAAHRADPKMASRALKAALRAALAVLKTSAEEEAPAEEETKAEEPKKEASKAKKAEEAKAEEAKAEEAKAEEEPKKEARARVQAAKAKKAEEEAPAEEESEEEESEDEESEKTASAFGLFSR